MCCPEALSKSAIMAFSVPPFAQNYSLFVYSWKSSILTFWIKLNKLMRIIQICLRNTLHAVLLVGAGCCCREPFPETDAARHEIFFCLASHLSIWHWKIPGQLIFSCIMGNLAPKFDTNHVRQGETIIILLQKYGIFGYTTDIDQLRQPQSNSK